MSTLFIAMMMTMASCSSSDNDIAENSNENKLIKMTFTAIQENSVGTRTTLVGGNGKQVLWEEGDKINVNGTGYTLNSGANTTLGTFDGYIKEGTSDYSAIYPYQTSSPTEDTAYAINFPSEQSAKAGTFDKNAAFMMAYSTDGKTTLDFKNAVALVKVTPKFDCKKIELKAGDNNVALAGSGHLKYNNGEPYINIENNQAYSITLNGPIEKNKSYYIVVPTVTLAAGWSISFTDNNNDVYTRTGGKEIKFARNNIINLGEFSRTDNKMKLTLAQNGNVPADKQVDMGVFTIGGKQCRLIFTTSNLTSSGLADDETKYGDYFAWGATEPWCKTYTRTIIASGVSVTADTWKEGYTEGYTQVNYNNYLNGKTIVDNYVMIIDYDFARQKLQGNWQIPTKEIWQVLYDTEKFDWQWKSVNGYYGRMVTSKSDSYKSIFLPASSYFSSKLCNDTDSRGDYWSTSSSSDQIALGLYFSETTVKPISGHYKYYGLSVRPVRLVAE